jgi:hypothetical protein
MIKATLLAIAFLAAIANALTVNTPASVTSGESVEIQWADAQPPTTIVRFFAYLMFGRIR